MKNTYLIAWALLFTAITFAQKKEIKKADKALNAAEFTEALAFLAQAEPMLDAADNDLKADYYLIKAQASLGTSGGDFGKMKAAAQNLSKAVEVNPQVTSDERYATTLYSLKEKMEKNAIADFDSKNFKMANEKFLTLYNTSKLDTIYLANAAISAKNGKDYDTAVEQYKQLLELGYTGIKSQLVATNKETGVVESFESEAQRALMIKAGTHIKPELQKTESSQEDILRNLTQMYIETGKNDDALKLIQDLRLKNPDDNLLLRTEADIYYELGNIDMYDKLISELVAKDSTNPELYFNLGVASVKKEKTEKAMEYYKRALELDPEYVSAHVNIASLILDKQTPIVDEMNALGTSREDFKRYDALKLELEALQKSSVPYLEKAFELRPDNVQYARTLMNIYSQLGQTDKADAIKVKVEELEGRQ